ncbi:MAG: lectin-like protein [Polyangiaceae bacterium]
MTAHSPARSLFMASLFVVAGCAYGIENEPWGDATAADSDVSSSADPSGPGGAGAAASGADNAASSSSTGGDDDEKMNNNSPFCGDGLIDAGEQCDDGNGEADDGCASCLVECDPQDVKDPKSHHCYHFVNLKAHWQAAENDCVVWGGAPGLGHLVSIQSADEQKLVKNLGDGAERWIGGADIAVEDNYTWTDGSIFAFENWRSGEPNNNGYNGGEEDCAEMEHDGRWDDQPCEKTKRYVCERIAAGAP